MGFRLTSKDYMEYIKLTAARIGSSKDYISQLDAATGDGDHWVNMNMGFEALVENADALSALALPEMFKQIGMKFIMAVGGSAGVLYGSAYMEAAKIARDMEYLDLDGLCKVLDAMLEAIMKRGNAQPGYKTMIDALFPAVQAYKQGLEDGLEEAALLKRVKKAAINGAQNTKDMVAVKGRACYQPGKGLSHLDPGAVTMSYQIETLMDFISCVA